MQYAQLIVASGVQASKLFPDTVITLDKYFFECYN